MNTSAVAQDKSCPFLGLNDDPQSLMAYTSPQNCCYRCKPVVPVNLEHQNSYCLDAAHVNCQALNQEAGTPLPRALRYKERGHHVSHSGWTRFIVVSVILIVLIILGAWILSANSPLGVFFSDTPSPVIVSATVLPTIQSPATESPQTIPSNTVAPSLGTPAPTFTLTVSPFPSLTPTSLSATPTKTPTATVTLMVSQTLAPSLTATGISPHSLEVPIGQGKFLLHRVLNGETLTGMAKKYGTTEEAIKAVNYNPVVPLWADVVIVIPLAATSVEGLPILESYQVTEDQVLPETLATQLSFDVKFFKDFNDLTDGEKLRKGDWFLIPRDSQK